MIHYLHDSIQYDTETETLMYTENIKKKIDGKNWHKYLDIIGKYKKKNRRKKLAQIFRYYRVGEIISWND